jgi:hypothetical protein
MQETVFFMIESSDDSALSERGIKRQGQPHSNVPAHQNSAGAASPLQYEVFNRSTESSG